jgi:hypothetical protein
MLVRPARRELKARLTRTQCLRAIADEPAPSEDGLGDTREVDARAMVLLDTNVLIHAIDEKS